MNRVLSVAGRCTVGRLGFALLWPFLLVACGDRITPTALPASSTTTAAPLPQVFSVTPLTSAVAVGHTAQLFVGVTADRGVSPAVLWSSSAPAVAVDASSSVLSEADLLTDCGSGDVFAASTHLPSSTQHVLVSISINTAARDTSGARIYSNGNCTLKTRLVAIGGQAFGGDNTVQLVLANP